MDCFRINSIKRDIKGLTIRGLVRQVKGVVDTIGPKQKLVTGNDRALSLLGFWFRCRDLRCNWLVDNADLKHRVRGRELWKR